MEQYIQLTGTATLNPQPKTHSEIRTHKVSDPMRYSTETDFQTPSQKMFFGENASLILSIENTNAPLMVEPQDMCLIGRVAAENPEKTVINLSPYNADARGVSRLHAVLYRISNTLRIEDMSSRNGTYVNGVRLIPHQVHTLQDGDELRLGALVMRIKFQPQRRPEAVA